MYFLGIDGGGTKTDFLVTDDRGNVIAQKRIGTVSYRIIGADSSIRLLNRTIAELLDKSPKSVDNALQRIKSKAEKMLNSTD